MLGVTHVSEILNATPGLTAVVWGLSNQLWQYALLPLAMDLLGIEGCLLWNSADGSITAPTVVVGSSTQLHFQIPNITTLIGVQVYLQAWTARPGATTLGIVMSNGLQLTIGDL